TRSRFRLRDQAVVVGHPGRRSASGDTLVRDCIGTLHAIPLLRSARRSARAGDWGCNAVTSAPPVGAPLDAAALSGGAAGTGRWGDVSPRPGVRGAALRSRVDAVADR